MKARSRLRSVLYSAVTVLIALVVVEVGASWLMLVYYRATHQQNFETYDTSYLSVVNLARRFRRAGLTKGVFYAAEEPHTAVAEIVFYRLLFYAESPATPWPQNAAEYTAFSAAYAAKKGIDLTAGKLQRDKALWMHLTEYEPCQRLADLSRSANVDVIRYLSVRDPRHGFNLALLTGRAFTKSKPVREQTWRIRLSDTGAQALCESPGSGITFGRETFAADPRIAKLRWKR